MNLEQIVKETVAKFVAEKKGKDLTGDGKIDSADYLKARSNAIEKAKMKSEGEDHEVSMAQSSLNSILRSAMELKAKIGNQEIDIPAWIQDHITNSENYIEQASQGYHEYSNGGKYEEMDEARFEKGTDIGGKGFEFKDIAKKAAKQYGSKEAGQRVAGAIMKKVLNKEGEGYDFIKSAIESASGDKITGVEEDDLGRPLYIGQDPQDQYYIGDKGEIVYDNYQKEIYADVIGNLEHYGDGQNHSVDDDMYEAFVAKSSFDDYSVGDNVTVAGKKAKITNMKMDDESGERRARVRFKDGTVKEISINTIDENTMTTNEGRSAEDIKQAQLDQAYASLEKKKENPRLFTKDDIKKTEDRIEKLEAELDALAAKATNESLDEATVRRWQHYAGIK
jgi:hypothetical protein